MVLAECSLSTAPSYFGVNEMTTSQETPKARRPHIEPSIHSEPYWRAAAGGELSIQHCGSCGNFAFYPRVCCPTCGATALTWQPVSGLGTVWSYSVVHRPVSKGFAPITPYAVALIDLDEGVRMMSNLITEGAAPHIGQRVCAVFERLDDDQQLPLFRAVAEQAPTTVERPS
jgi:uncharacterized OB-fold protein